MDDDANISSHGVGEVLARTAQPLAELEELAHPTLKLKFPPEYRVARAAKLDAEIDAGKSEAKRRRQLLADEREADSQVDQLSDPVDPERAARIAEAALLPRLSRVEAANLVPELLALARRDNGKFWRLAETGQLRLAAAGHPSGELDALIEAGKDADPAYGNRRRAAEKRALALEDYSRQGLEIDRVELRAHQLMGRTTKATELAISMKTRAAARAQATGRRYEDPTT